MPATASDQAPHLHSLIFDWLAFFKTHYRELLDEYARLQTRKLDVASALSLARHYSADDKAPGLDHNDLLALDALLNRLTPETLLRPVPVEPSAPIHWRLPKPNPFLHASADAALPPCPSPALMFSDRLPAAGEASLYLRWTLDTPQPTLHRMLHGSLQTLIADAGQAGVTLAFTSYGNHWQLKLGGLDEPMPAVLDHALQVLAQPTADTLARYGQPDSEPALIPIRQLLKTLPDHYLTTSVAHENRDAHAAWSHARWRGYAVGFDGEHRAALAHALRHMPGTPEASPPASLAPIKASRWAVEPSASSEDALLMFYPAPSTSVEDEAIWRFFAHIIQAPFYQRLRVELQLGYAVFSGFRQIAGHGGLLFGVQSPSASAEELVGHISGFLQTLPALIEACDLPPLINALKAQLELPALEFQQAAEILWQTHLAGHGYAYAERMQHSLAHLRMDALKNAASRVALSETPVLYLSNRTEPDGLWPARP